MELLPRKSPRIKYYDYSNANYYFITICTHRQRCLFGLPDRRTNLGMIAEKHIAAIERHYHCVHVDKFVVMPNHIHLLLQIHTDSNGRSMIAPTISTVVRLMKGTASKQAGFSLWQKGFHDHVIRNDKDYQEVWNYIEGNPGKWVEDKLYNG